MERLSHTLSPPDLARGATRIEIRRRMDHNALQFISVSIYEPNEFLGRTYSGCVACSAMRRPLSISSPARSTRSHFALVPGDSFGGGQLVVVTEECEAERSGLAGHDWQSLYHFTIGGPIEDLRLRTAPPYAPLVGDTP
jgi:hypothetical protein